MRLRNRDRVRRTIELTLGWEKLQQYEKDDARHKANRILDALEAEPANGKAAERFLRDLDQQEVA